MFELFLPYIFARAIGIDPQAQAVAPSAPDVEVASAEAAPETAPETALAGREPEPQVPTGQFTTAVEIKQIMTMTKPQWIAIQDNGAQDLLYFTQLLSWRCGMWEIRYGLNGAPAETLLDMEPCHEPSASPNAMTDPGGAYPIYLAEPSGSIQSVSIAIVYDDGTTDSAEFERTSVLLP
jgi:hypothetical protein